MENPFIIGLCGLIGLGVSSLVTRLSYRIPRILITHWQRHQLISYNLFPPGFSQFLLSSSFCPHCHHRLSWHSLIPLYSWYKQKGRCHHCQQTISPLYPLTEIGVTLIFMLTASVTQEIIWLFILLTVTTLLITATLIDMTHQLLPDLLTIPLIFSGLCIALSGYTSLRFSDALLGAIGGFLFLWLPAKAFLLITNRQGLGGGDIKLFAGLGAWLGPDILPTLIFAASSCALCFMLVRNAYTKKREQRVAFGPFIAFVGWLALIKDPFMIELPSLLQAFL